MSQSETGAEDVDRPPAERSLAEHLVTITLDEAWDDLELIIDGVCRSLESTSDQRARKISRTLNRARQRFHTLYLTFLV